MNIKTNLEGTIKRNPLHQPFYNSQDYRSLFLEKFVLWLDFWKKNYPNLTSDTHMELRTSADVMIKYI